MPCLHPRWDCRPAITTRKNAPKQRARHPLPEAGGRSSIYRGPQPKGRDHAPVASDTWLSEAASEFRPSWREARRLMLETHRLPESARFVEADSRSVKCAKLRKHAGFSDS